jgi:hypothetical protein
MKCPFAAALTRSVATCHAAQEVVRRGGTEIDCRLPPAHARCTELFDGLKARGLTAFDVEHDLTQMPHSVLVKIQCGGLVGVHRLLGGSDDSTPIADVADLVERALAQFGTAAGIPSAELDDAIRSFQLERRAGRRRR